MKYLLFLCAVMVCLGSICPANGTPAAANTVPLDKLQLNGTAHMVYGVLRLTDAAVSQAGTAFYPTPVNITGFDTAFTFWYHDGTSPSADGIAFCIQNDPRRSIAIGSVGGFLGVGKCDCWGTAGIENSVYVEFDNYYNDIFSDPQFDHIGVDFNGSMLSSMMAASPVQFLPDGPTSARITYDGEYIAVYVWNTGGCPAQPVLYCPVDIPSIVKSDKAYVGFTGATATYMQCHDILSWQYHSFSR